MNYEFVTRTVNAQPLAAVRRRSAHGEVDARGGRALDLVWNF
jgi:hypothetical protein